MKETKAMMDSCIETDIRNEDWSSCKVAFEPLLKQGKLLETLRKCSDENVFIRVSFEKFPEAALNVARVKV